MLRLMPVPQTLNLSSARRTSIWAFGNSEACQRFRSVIAKVGAEKILCAMKQPKHQFIALVDCLMLALTVTIPFGMEERMPSRSNPRYAESVTSSPKARQENCPPCVRFLVVFKPGPKWIADKSVFEQPLKPHAQYMQKLYDEGKLLYAGPFLDDSGGLAILNVSSKAEADQILAQEPATLEHIFIAESHPWYLTFDASQQRSLRPGNK